MRWVDVTSYIGLDRRYAGAFRLFDRRGERADAAAPSLSTALRQLRLRCLESYDQAGFDAFCARARGTAQLAIAYDAPEISSRLMSLIEAMSALATRGDYVGLVEMLERVMPDIEAAAS